MKYDIIFLRPHHALCMYFFTGRGYNRDFCENMRSLQQRLNVGNMICLTESKDDVCEYCPRLFRDICKDDAKTSTYDKKFLQICVLEMGSVVSWKMLCGLIQDKILKVGKRRLICKNCRWSKICDERERELQCQ